MLRGELTVGVDIGGTRTKYGLVNTMTSEVLQSIVQPTETEEELIFLTQLAAAINAFRKVANESNSKIAGIGFGIPGFINENSIISTTYGFLPFMEAYPLKAIVEKEFALPCFIDNDARTVSLGEALYGKGIDYKRVLTLTLGTGVGFGFVVDGRFAEPLPLAHMGGHMKISDEGDTCYCGKKGCLEALVSSTGIVNLAKKYGWPGELSAEAIFKAASMGDESAAAVVEKVVTYLHSAIHNYVNLFAPDMIVLGGGIAKGLTPYLEKIKGQCYLSPYPDYTFQLQVSELQEHAGMLGSAALLLSDNYNHTKA